MLMGTKIKILLDNKSDVMNVIDILMAKMCEIPLGLTV